jgi:hypothetical protein
MDPLANEQFLTPPFLDSDNDQEADVVEVLRSVTPGMVALYTPKSFIATATSYGAGITQAGKILNFSDAQRKFIVFAAATENNHEPGIDTEIPKLSPGVIVHTIAIGPDVTCASPGTGGFGSLQEIADRTGGTCVNVRDADDFDRLPVIAPAPTPISRLTELTLTVDGNPAPIIAIAPPLPRNGKASIVWITTVDALASGSHEICATAVAEDPGGTGSIVDCVTVTVNSPPVARCRDVVIAAGPACNAPASINDGSFDPDGGSLMCTQTPPGPFGPGTATAILVCRDPVGAIDVCTGHVTVVDETPPLITCPPNQVAECVNGGAAGVFPDATAVDNCGPAPAVCVPPSGSSFGLGSTPVACTATDGSGNQAACMFNVTVADTTPPVVTVQGGGQLWPPNHKYVTKTLANCGVAINDQCQGMIALASANAAITCVTSDEVDNDGGDGNTTQDMVIVNATTVNLRSERSGNGDGRVYKINFRVTDAAGNVGTGVCQVGVPHDQGSGTIVDSGVVSTVGTCN